jgi:hypothetical protein
MLDRPKRGAILALAVLPVAIFLGAAFSLPLAPAGPASPPGPAVAPEAPGELPGCVPVVFAAVLVLDNASPASCFVFESTPATPANVSLHWAAFPDPAFVHVVLGPAVPVGPVACPLFVALLYSANGTSGSAELHVTSSSPGLSDGCVWPYHLDASSNATGDLAPGETVVAMITPADSTVPGCVLAGTVSVSPTPASACTAGLD